MSFCARKLLGAAAIVPLTFLLAACGDDDSDPAPTSEPGGSSLDAAAAGLAECLTDAGIQATVSASTAIAVDAEHRIVDVEGLDASTTITSNEQGASLYVVEDAATAEENFTAFTLTKDPDDQSWMAGRVVIRFNYIAVPDAPQVQQIQTCADAV